LDQFEVFFTFYGLLLGLAAAEILSSLGRFARQGALRAIRAQAALLAILTFLLICATWIDAWNLRATFTLDFRSLWAPIGAATAYYLAAVVAFPRESSAWSEMDRYFAERKGFIIAALVAAELFVKVMYIPVNAEQLRTAPMVFWLHSMPLNLAIFGTFAAMYFARSRRANIAAIIAQIAVFTIPYWSGHWSSNIIREAYGYAVT
jgi:uncharacterized membrane protein